VMEGTAAVLMVLLGLEVVPPFDQPWRSISIADFWSRCGHPREMERELLSDASTNLPVTCQRLVVCLALSWPGPAPGRVM
jgi:hypothetical protein